MTDIIEIIIVTLSMTAVKLTGKILVNTLIELISRFQVLTVTASPR